MGLLLGKSFHLRMSLDENDLQRHEYRAGAIKRLNSSVEERETSQDNKRIIVCSHRTTDYALVEVQNTWPYRITGVSQYLLMIL